jgi:hypothetical protein
MNQAEYDEEKRTLEVLSRAISATLGGATFSLLVFDTEGDELIVNYVSNASREASVDVMKDFVARNEGALERT